MVKIPAPSSGMGFDLNRDVTTSELVSGGRSVYRTPLGFKSFSMNWSGGTENLGTFMDIFEGVYGNGPFYILDPRSEGQNQLPARWASCWQLGHLANGWGQPKVSQNANLTPEGLEVLFTGRANLPLVNATSPFRVVVPLQAEKTYHIKAWGEATGGAQLVATPLEGTSPGVPVVLSLDGTPSPPFYGGENRSLRLHLYVPAGSTLTLRHMELMVGTWFGWHMGRGVGAVQFDGNMQGTLTSSKVDRIGLSAGMIEVEE